MATINTKDMIETEHGLIEWEKVDVLACTADDTITIVLTLPDGMLAKIEFDSEAAGYLADCLRDGICMLSRGDRNYNKNRNRFEF